MGVLMFLFSLVNLGIVVFMVFLVMRAVNALESIAESVREMKSAGK